MSKHESTCQCDRCRELKGQDEAEKLKKALFYDPDTCPDMDEQGCTFPDCHNCGVDYSEGEDS